MQLLLRLRDSTRAGFSPLSTTRQEANIESPIAPIQSYKAIRTLLNSLIPPKIHFAQHSSQPKCSFCEGKGAEEGARECYVPVKNDVGKGGKTTRIEPERLVEESPEVKGGDTGGQRRRRRTLD